MTFSTPEVDKYLTVAPESQAQVMSKLREILSGVDSVSEAWAWSRPCYRVNGKHICYMVANKNDVNFGFEMGAHFADPNSLLKGTGANMRHIKLKSAADIDESACGDFIAQAVKFANS